MKIDRRIKCPVCQTLRCKQGMRGHINGLARMEVYWWYADRKLSMPHQKWLEQHTKYVKRKLILL